MPPPEAGSRSSLTTGASAGPFELTRPLGGGAFGQVWLARHTLLDTPRTVKVVPAGAYGDVELDGVRRYAG